MSRCSMSMLSRWTLASLLGSPRRYTSFCERKGGRGEKWEIEWGKTEQNNKKASWVGVDPVTLLFHSSAYQYYWHPYWRGIAKFGWDRDGCSKIEDVTIPYSNYSQSIKDSWFASFSTLVPTKNAKWLTPLLRTAKFGEDMDRCSKIEDVTIPYSNTSQSIKDSWFVYSSTHDSAKNANSHPPLLASEGLAKGPQCRVQDRRLAALSHWSQICDRKKGHFVLSHTHWCIIIPRQNKGRLWIKDTYGVPSYSEVFTVYIPFSCSSLCPLEGSE